MSRPRSKSGSRSRWYALLLTVFILSGTLLIQNPTRSLGAGTDPTLKVGSCEIAPGEIGVVAVTGQNIPAPGLAGYQLIVQYDQLKLEVLGMEKSAADAFSMQISKYDTPGTLRLSAIQATGVEGDITLARIRIKAKSSAVGSADLKLTIQELVLEDLQKLQAQAVNGKVTFSGDSEQITPSSSPLTISIVNLPTATINKAYSYTLRANNGTPPYLWSASGLPDGLTLNSKTGEISGTPSAQSESSFVQISVTDAQTSNQPVTAQFPLEVVDLTPTGTTATETTPNRTTTTGTTSSGTVSNGGVPEQILPSLPSKGSGTTRLSGNTASQTAVKIAEKTGWKGTAILASSEAYGLVDALTAGPLATYLKAPILLTESGNQLNSDTKAGLAKLEVKTVYVTSGTGVISQAILNELMSMGIKVVTLGGTDRFETSVNIANKMVELGAPITKVAVAYGWKNQDALSIAPIASAQTEPILLTEKDSIPASVKSFLSANTSIKQAEVIGGTGVISEAVRAQLPSSTRCAGVTAYDTNTQVIQQFDSIIKYDRVYLANGETAIDALAGVPLAAQDKAAIVLTNQVAPDVATFVNSRLTSGSIVTALGGTAVVPASVVAGVAGE